MRVIEPQRRKPADLSAWWVRIATILAVGASPWWYGTVTWEAQSFALVIGILLAVSVMIHAVMAYSAGETGWGPNWLAWTLFGLGCFSLLQAQSRYPWIDAGGSVPPSVQLQRWALGLAEAPEGFAKSLAEDPGGGAFEREIALPVGVACGLEHVPEAARTLAISVEPNVTRGAAASLFLSSIMVWIGSSCFFRRSSFPALLLGLTLLGCAVAMIGILGVVAPPSIGWLGARPLTSFATFISKNSAGAFLNIAIASALGLVSWAMIRARKGTLRHRDERDFLPWNERLLRGIQDFLAHLETMQLFSWIALVILVAGLMLSLSRGAIVSGLAAALMAVYLTLPGKQSGAAALAALAVAGLCLALIVGFQMDEKVITRMETLGGIDLETESRAGRIYVWGVSWSAAQFFGWLGSGLGTFHFASLPFQRPSFSGWHYHAESTYAEAWVTLGYMGLAVVLGAIVACYRHLRGIYTSERFVDFVPIQRAGLYLLISQAIHGAVDFSIILPGVYLPAALLMGAALGANPESNRIKRKIKRQKSGASLQSREEDGMGRGGKLILASSMALVLSSIAALLYCRGSVQQLATAESIERAIEQDDQSPVGDWKRQERVSFFIDRLAERGGRLDDSPQLLRLLADAICFDGRMQAWKNRSSADDPKTVWNATSPFVLRIALATVEPRERDRLVESLGGSARMEALSKANTFYAQGQALAPLDWRLIWGRITTAVTCPPSEFAPLVPVIRKTSSHMPQLLTSASILFGDAIQESERFTLWRTAIHTSIMSAFGIGGVMKTLYADGSVPLEVFPSHGPLLRGLASNVFLKDRFPQTHAKLLELALQAGPPIDLSTTKQYLWKADVAMEAGDLNLEIKHLDDYLMIESNDTKTEMRRMDRWLQQGKIDAAETRLRQLQRKDPTNPEFMRLSDRIMKQRVESN